MVKSELENIQSRFGMISMKLDECNLSEIAKRSVMLIDHARASKDNDLISHKDYLKIINRLNEYIDDADQKCACKER